jgi:hypothetical protein
VQDQRKARPRLGPAGPGRTIPLGGMSVRRPIEPGAEMAGNGRRRLSTTASRLAGVTVAAARAARHSDFQQVFLAFACDLKPVEAEQFVQDRQARNR